MISTEPPAATNSLLGEQGAAADERPNVLFVICDQMRADHLGFAGNLVVRTPNIDRLAHVGTVFDRAYVNNPVCMPNRSSLMTGRLPSAHGVIFNDRPLDVGANTFVRRLRAEGWRTALIGKSHLQHGMSRETVRSSGLEPGRFSPHPALWDTVEHQERYEAGEWVDPDDFYGFEHIELTIGHGAWSGGHHYLWALEQGISHDALTCGLDPNVPIDGRSAEWWQVHPAPFPDEVYSTTFVTERTLAFIDECQAARDPWMVWCSFPDPHHPFSPPEPWFSRHDPNDIDLPRTFNDPGEDWPQHLHSTRNRPFDPAAPYVHAFGPSEAQARGAIAATYGMIEAIDHGVGRILDSLPTDRETIVVFTTDHGDMMGEHGLILKGAMHFDACIRTPLIIRSPGLPAQRTQSLAASIDLPATILDLCDVPAYDGMQGHSLVPTLADARVTVRDAVLIEDDFPNAGPRNGLPAQSRTLVTKDHRMTRDSTGHTGVYDLVNDPDEYRNLNTSGSPAVRAELADLMVDCLMTATDSARAEPVTVGLPE